MAPRWLEGLDLLGAATGLRAAVVPHYDNAEGGTHDTRFCYMGERRLRKLEATLPEGAFVLGVSMKKLEARRTALLLTLFVTFTIFAFVTIAAIYLMVRSAMRPVTAVTEAAEAISMGEGLETSIKTDATNEIGQLTRAVERLRISMKAAMSRLGGQ